MVDLEAKPYLAAGSGTYRVRCKGCGALIGRVRGRFLVESQRPVWRWRLDGAPGSVRSTTGPSEDTMDGAMKALAAESSHVCEDNQ